MTADRWSDLAHMDEHQARAYLDSRSSTVALVLMVVCLLAIVAAGLVGIRWECERLHQTDPARALETCGP